MEKKKSQHLLFNVGNELSFCALWLRRNNPLYTLPAGWFYISLIRMRLNRIKQYEYMKKCYNGSTENDTNKDMSSSTTISLFLLFSFSVFFVVVLFKWVEYSFFHDFFWPFATELNKWECYFLFETVLLCVWASEWVRVRLSCLSVWLSFCLSFRLSLAVCCARRQQWQKTHHWFIFESPLSQINSLIIRKNVN